MQNPNDKEREGRDKEPQNPDRKNASGQSGDRVDQRGDAGTSNRSGEITEGEGDYLDSQ